MAEWECGEHGGHNDGSEHHGHEQFCYEIGGRRHRQGAFEGEQAMLALAGDDHTEAEDSGAHNAKEGESREDKHSCLGVVSNGGAENNHAEKQIKQNRKTEEWNSESGSTEHSNSFVFCLGVISAQQTARWHYFSVNEVVRKLNGNGTHELTSWVSSVKASARPALRISSSRRWGSASRRRRATVSALLTV